MKINQAIGIEYIIHNKLWGVLFFVYILSNATVEKISKKDDFRDLVSYLNTNRNKEHPQPFEYIIIKDREYDRGPSLADMVNLDISESW